MLFSLMLASPSLANKEKAGVAGSKAEIQTALEQHNKAFNAKRLKGVVE